jgi:hypothetical protein
MLVVSETTHAFETQTDQCYIEYGRNNTQSVTWLFMEAYRECFVSVDIISIADLCLVSHPHEYLLRGLKVTSGQPPLLITGN